MAQFFAILATGLLLLTVSHSTLVRRVANFVAG